MSAGWPSSLSPGPEWAAIHVEENSQESSANPSSEDDSEEEDELEEGEEEDELEEGEGLSLGDSFRKRKGYFGSVRRERPKRARYVTPMEGVEGTEGSTHTVAQASAATTFPLKAAPASMLMPPPPSNPPGSASISSLGQTPITSSSGPPISNTDRLNFCKTGADSGVKTKVRKRSRNKGKDEGIGSISGPREGMTTATNPASPAHPRLLDPFFPDLLKKSGEVGSGLGSKSSSVSTGDQGKHAGGSGELSIPAFAKTAGSNSILARKLSGDERKHPSGKNDLDYSSDVLMALRGSPSISRKVSSSNTGKGVASGSLITNPASNEGKLPDGKSALDHLDDVFMALPGSPSVSQKASSSNLEKGTAASSTSAAKSIGIKEKHPSGLRKASLSKLGVHSPSKRSVPGPSHSRTHSSSSPPFLSPSSSSKKTTSKTARASEKKTVTPVAFAPPSTIKLMLKSHKKKNKTPRQSVAARLPSEVIEISDSDSPSPLPRPRPKHANTAPIPASEVLEFFSSGEEERARLRTGVSLSMQPLPPIKSRPRPLPKEMRHRHSMPNPDTEVIELSYNDDEPLKGPVASTSKSALSSAAPVPVAASANLGRPLHDYPVRHYSTDDPMNAHEFSPDSTSQSMHVSSSVFMGPCRPPARRQSTMQSAGMMSDDPISINSEFEPLPPPSPSSPTPSRPQTPPQLNRRANSDFAMSTSLPHARRSLKARETPSTPKNLTTIFNHPPVQPAGLTVLPTIASLPATPLAQPRPSAMQKPPSSITTPSSKRKSLTKPDLLPAAMSSSEGGASLQLPTPLKNLIKDSIGSSGKKNDVGSAHGPSSSATSGASSLTQLPKTSIRPKKHFSLRSKDKRPLNVALGLEPTSSTQPAGGKTANTPQQVSNNSKRSSLPSLKPSSHGPLSQKPAQSVAEAIILAGKLNAARGADKPPDGASRDQAIDLTLDDSEYEEPPPPEAVESSKILVDFLVSRREAKANAKPSSSSRPPGDSSQRTTDELVIHPSQPSAKAPTSPAQLPVRPRLLARPLNLSGSSTSIKSVYPPHTSAGSKPERLVSYGGIVTPPSAAMADSESTASHSHPPSSSVHSPPGSPSPLNGLLPSSSSAPPGSPVPQHQRQFVHMEFTRSSSTSVLDRMQSPSIRNTSSPLTNSKSWLSAKVAEQSMDTNVLDPHVHRSIANTTPAAKITPSIVDIATLSLHILPQPSSSDTDDSNMDGPNFHKPDHSSVGERRHPIFSAAVDLLQEDSAVEDSVEEGLAGEDSAGEDIGHYHPAIDKFLESDPEAAIEAEECEALLEYIEDRTSEAEGSGSARECRQVSPTSDNLVVPEGAAVMLINEEASNGEASGGSSPRVNGALRHSSRRSSAISSSEGPIPHDDDKGAYESPASSPGPSSSGPVFATEIGKTYGGIKAITWEDYRRNLDNFAQKCYYSKDLPHSLQDTINSMSEETRMLSGIREVFRATIRENTAEDESNAPDIEVVNDVDKEPAPPWEFYYTNKMWHGEGVPPPIMEGLTSCNCIGKCDPKSKTCACLQNQLKYYDDQTADFIYDNRGRLKHLGYPIFECNDLCGCDDECRNRVVQHGRKVPVKIAKTAAKGWGVFNGPKKIYEGTFIGVYSGELLTDTESEQRGIKYNMFGRTYLFDLDFHHLKVGKKDWNTQYVVDAYHAGNFTRFVNHSCDPNSRFYPCYINEANIDKPLLTVFAIRDIEADEEITFSYTGYYPGDGVDDDEENGKTETANSDEPTINKNLKNAAIYHACLCGAATCKGFIFN